MKAGLKLVLNLLVSVWSLLEYIIETAGVGMQAKEVMYDV